MVGHKSRITILKNITIYTTTDFPFGGAAENFVRQLAIGLNISNVKVNIVLLRGHYLKKCINNTGIYCSCLLLKTRFKNEILKFIEFFLLILTIPFSIIRNRIQHKTNVLILYGIDYFYLVFPFYVFSRLLRIKIIRIVTDRYSEKGIAPTWWKQPKVFFYNLQYRFFDKYLSGIVCLSNYLKENAIKYDVKTNKICVIPHFIDIERFSNETNGILPFKKQKIRIGICGTLNENNGLFILLKAFCLVYNMNSNIELYLIGSISKDDLSISKNILGKTIESIIFVGEVQSELVPKLLSSCDILANPRISGTLADAGFPTKLGEYFSTKLPVIATSVGDLKKYFENGNQLILVEPDSYTTFADGIKFLLENQEIAIKIGQNGYNWAKTNLDYVTNAKKLLSFLQNL